MEIDGGGRGRRGRERWRGTGAGPFPPPLSLPSLPLHFCRGRLCVAARRGRACRGNERLGLWSSAWAVLLLVQEKRGRWWGGIRRWHRLTPAPAPVCRARRRCLRACAGGRQFGRLPCACPMGESDAASVSARSVNELQDVCETTLSVISRRQPLCATTQPRRRRGCNHIVKPLSAAWFKTKQHTMRDKPARDAAGGSAC